MGLRTFPILYHYLDHIFTGTVYTYFIGCNEYEILKNLQKLPLTESQYLHSTQKFDLFMNLLVKLKEMR